MRLHSVYTQKNNRWQKTKYYITANDHENGHDWLYYPLRSGGLNSYAHAREIFGDNYRVSKKISA